jgi:hypothetical protein
MNILKFIVLMFILPTLMICCNDATEKGTSSNDSTSSKKDSSYTDTTYHAENILSIPINKDTCLFIDSVVRSINEKIKSGILKKKEEECEDGLGGYVYGYFDGDSLRMLYSKSSGGEFGHDERKSYFLGSRIIYAEYRFYWIYRKEDGSVKSESMVAEKKYFLLKSDSLGDSLRFIDGIKVPCKGMNFTREDVPLRKKILEIDKKLIANLKTNCR